MARRMPYPDRSRPVTSTGPFGKGSNTSPFGWPAQAAKASWTSQTPTSPAGTATPGARGSADVLAFPTLDPTLAQGSASAVVAALDAWQRFDPEVELRRQNPGAAAALPLNRLPLVRAALGDAFDIRAFHAAVLEDGALPLPLLEAKIDAWIAAERERLDTAATDAATADAAAQG